jgi:signal transduction histidine kinase
LHQQVGKERITTDYNILQTILRNLVSNALKFTPEGGHIYLAYQQEGRQGILSVRDTGAGMSAEKVSTLFQGIQFKSEQGLRGEKGTGIGLQLCYELAQQINATLSVESQEGQGTIFSLILSI